jgi:protein-tyrosine phosphatase
MAGKKTLVHCQAGLNRSSLIVARTLMLGQDMTAKDAIALIREKRSPMCLCNDTFRIYLERLDG